MLSSIQAPDAMLNRISPADGSSSFDDLGNAGPGTRLSRFRIPLSESAESSGFNEDAYWLGPREFTEEQIEELATRIVEQVRERGPFLSMGEFVNRQLNNSEFSMSGVLQSAIDATTLNGNYGEQALAGSLISDTNIAGYNYQNEDAATGWSFQGAPGYLSQADLLTALGNAATARSDTFTIRSYGDSRDKTGQVQATAYCEAVVQRFPEWIDEVDLAEIRPGQLNSEANSTFGRRFRIVSFRWLSESEI